MLIFGHYNSLWAEGEVQSTCTLCTQTWQLQSVSASDEGDTFEALISESVEFELNGHSFTLEAEQGMLTAQGSEQFKCALQAAIA